MSNLLYPPSIDWELTEECNHRCTHCYNYWRQSPITPTNNTEDFYIDIANKIVEAHPVSVQITGGEPLLVWGKAKKAIDILIKNSITVSINTNATLVTDDIAEYISKNKMDAFISFPCVREDIFDELVMCKGAMKRAVKGIHLLKDHGVRISLNMVVTRKNLPFVYETAKFVKGEFGVSYFSAAKASFPTGARMKSTEQFLNVDEFNTMLSELMRVKEDLGMRVDSAWVYSLCGFNDNVIEQFGFNRKCTCGRYSFVIDARGNIKACGCDDNSYGNLLTGTFSEAIAKMNMWHDGRLLPQDCKKCRWLLYCGGGCRADACGLSGNVCAYDSTARPMMAEKELTKKKALDEIVKKGIFTINPDVVFTTENEMVRIHYKTNYEFVSFEFADFLSSDSPFDVELIAELSHNDIRYTSAVIEKMCRKGIIVNTDGVVSKQYMNKDGFQLLISPYCEDNFEDWQRDYAGYEYSCKKYM